MSLTLATVTSVSPVAVALDGEPDTAQRVTLLSGQAPEVGDRVLVDTQPKGVRPVLVWARSA